MKPEQFIREKGLDKCGDEFEQHFLSLPFSNSEAAQKCLDACDFDVKQNAFIPNAKWFNNNDVDEGVIYCCMLNTAYMSFLKQQAKVEGLKATIKGNHGRIAELERLNRVKAQAILDLHQEIKELKASHHGEVIGHEVHLKNIKQERDELQTLYTQQGINMFKLQKRVDAVIIEIENMYLSGAIGFDTVKKLEQALKGGGQ
ncbi:MULTISPECIES: hypothetical protein [Acinetobacter calcoaceticus/baumannii complex]|uniref:hypothetical protein n=1 Tax=Acinetobacter calcoaceticus/baumannii complex TaxID=909768 RepID=UPI00029C8DC1|nr:MULTISPECIES: hypothetical protein [Acinetobacter calcoaceticus/baumannii complex]EKU39893.1 hypothetical protein ACINWC141_1284 [Acinetobacter sp. WC-141]RRJ45759.1 hypothetical protein EIK84_19570 [Acinetobacter baumannii]